MSYSLRLKAALGLLLVLAVGLKLALRGSLEGTNFDFTREISEAFSQNGFTLQYYPPDVNLPRIGAIRDRCRIMIVNSSPLGYHMDTIRRSAQRGDHVFFLYRNIRYEDQPRWRTLLDHYWLRLNRLVGRFIPVSPVLGVIQSSECDRAQTGWLEKLEMR